MIPTFRVFSLLLLQVHVASLADFYYQHFEHPVLDVCDDTVLSDSVAPKVPVFAFQRLAEQPGVLAALDVRFHPLEESFLN